MAEKNSSSGSKKSKDKGKGKQIEQNDPASEAVPKKETEKANPKAVEKMLKSLGLTSILPGAIVGGKKEKEMSSYKFWKTQPVPSFEDVKKPVPSEEEGPIKEVDINKVSKDSPPLPAGYEWVTMDLTNDTEVQEVYELLSEHYVEDDEQMFRFNYSRMFFSWALKAPGWRNDWHIGVRVGKTKKLIAFISGIPINLRIREKTFKAAEVNYLCVHKKLREKRLAPVLIKEVTRRFNVHGIFQAIYTAGVVIPSPVSTCRYFHRTLDFDKLYDVGFSPLAPGTTRQRMNVRYKLPSETSTPGLRPMEEKDITQVGELLKKYLGRFDMAQDFSHEDLDHWFIHKDGRGGAEQVVWTYVVERDGKVTDFFSFYRLESTIIRANSNQHKVIKAAYLYYYATDVAFQDDAGKLKTRLNELMNDNLILAKQNGFDVVNGLTLLDNPLFLEDQKFGPGDGHLHYYLFNYRASPIAGGVNARDNIDVKSMGGVGMVML